MNVPTRFPNGDGAFLLTTGVSTAHPMPAETGTSAESTANFPLVDPDDLAEQYWSMYTERDRIEQGHPQYQALRVES